MFVLGEAVTFYSDTLTMYFYLSSNSSQEYFPDNKPYSFRTRLDYPVSFNGEWEVALTSINIPRLKNDYDAEYFIVKSSLCKESFFHSSQTQILDRLFPAEMKPSWTVRFPNPQYVPINTQTTYIIDLHIYDNTGAHPSFRQGEVYCTLHIRRCQS